jgi:protein involved in polysaccharide export with SLBB domain
MLRLFWYIATVVSVLACASHTGTASAPPAQPASDALRPGDLVRLRIWREPDLSGEFTIDETGTVTFPKIGAYRADTESPESLKEKVVKAYQVYLVNPSIDIVVLRRVNILGAVRNPGLYPVDATMTIADVLAVAGGATQVGDADRVELVRGGDRVHVRLSQRTRLTESPVRSGDQLYVPERSWVSRNTGILAAFITASISLAVTFAR